MEILIFYSPLCLHCSEAIKVVREFAEEYEIKVQEVNVLSPEGQEKAEKCNVKVVPSIFANKAKILGVPTKEKLRNIVEMEQKRDFAKV